MNASSALFHTHHYMKYELSLSQSEEMAANIPNSLISTGYAWCTHYMYKQVTHNMHVSKLSMPYDEKDTNRITVFKKRQKVIQHNTVPNRVKEQGWTLQD
jgi:hypothetical protein